jgi:hypothetical protein
MENDIYSLLGYRQGPAGPKKSSSSSRIDTLLDRGTTSSAKINTLKITQKAREMQEMKSVPTINEKSRKIAENMKRERMDLISKYEAKTYQIESSKPVQPVEPEPVRISVNIMKQLEMSEPPPCEPDLKSMNIHERSKYWKEQKEKKLEEQRKAKKDQELDGCTFKPKKIDPQDFEIQQRPPELNNNRRASAGVKGMNERDSGRRREEEVKTGKDSKEDKSLAFLLKGVANDKSSSQPVKASVQTVQVRPGFLSELAKPRNK